MRRRSSRVAGSSARLTGDAFETLVLPRTAVHRLRLTSRYYRATWRPWVVRAPVLDPAAIVKVGIEGLPPWRAHLAFAIARHGAVDLIQVLGEIPARMEDRLPPPELAVMRCELERAGLHLNASPDADRELAALRRSSKPYIPLDDAGPVLARGRLTP